MDQLDLGVLPCGLSAPEVVHLTEPRASRNGPGRHPQVIQNQVPGPIRLQSRQQLAAFLLQLLKAGHNPPARFAAVQLLVARLDVLLQEGFNVLEDGGLAVGLPHFRARCGVEPKAVERRAGSFSRSFAGEAIGVGL